MGTHPIFESDFDCLTDTRNGFLSQDYRHCADYQHDVPRPTPRPKRLRNPAVGSNLCSVPPERYLDLWRYDFENDLHVLEVSSCHSLLLLCVLLIPYLFE